MIQNRVKIKFHILSFLNLWATLFLFIGVAHSQPLPPELLCADVQADGSVILTWSTPPNVPVGANYKIFRDVGDGNGFVPINTIGPETSISYQDGLVDASQGSVTYRLQTIANGSSAPGNSVSTLFLQLAASNLSSVAELSWNTPFSTPPTDGQFVVYRNINGSGYNAIANLNPGITSYSDTLFGLCSDEPIPITYKVSFLRAECEMFSQETINEFQDLFGPTAPLVETVLINPLTGNAELYWYPSNAPDLEKYLIQSVVYQAGNTVYLNTGYVAAGQPTSFNYFEANTDKPTNMVVIAFDSCGNDQSFSNVYSTIYASDYYVECNQTAEVSWTPYSGWDEGVSSYKIHAFINNGSDVVLNSVSGDTLSYTFEIEPNTEYCIYIEAVSNGVQRPSTSNMTCFETKYPQVISYNYLNRVTVIDDHHIQIDLYQDVNGVGTTYELMRSKSGGAFHSLGQYAPTSNPVLTVIDSDVEADEAVYTYKWKAYDGCGQELPDSNIGRNILLKENELAFPDSLVNAIVWNQYANWDGGVTSYEIYRKLGSETNFSLLTVEDPSTTFYEEGIQNYMFEEGTFCYKVVAIEGENQFGLEATSASNIHCITQEPIVWIPNAMMLNNADKTFKPTASFIDFDSYQMEIYNKWGQKIFSSNEVENGWDGMINGEPARWDYYRYIIAYSDGSGKAYVKQGVLYVVQ